MAQHQSVDISVLLLAGNLLKFVNQKCLSERILSRIHQILNRRTEATFSLALFASVTITGIYNIYQCYLKYLTPTVSKKLIVKINIPGICLQL